MKNFNELSEREILALAISLEEEDERVYADFFDGLRLDFAASAAVFDSMRKEESEHRRRLIELYRRHWEALATLSHSLSRNFSLPWGLQLSSSLSNSGSSHGCDTGSWIRQCSPQLCRWDLAEHSCSLRASLSENRKNSSSEPLATRDDFVRMVYFERNSPKRASA
jgi:hypothetical protein